MSLKIFLLSTAGRRRDAVVDLLARAAEAALHDDERGVLPGSACGEETDNNTGITMLSGQ